MQIGDVTISAALTWFLGACVAVAAIAKAVEIIKGLFGRGKINSDIKRHEEALTKISADVERMPSVKIRMRILTNLFVFIRNPTCRVWRLMK